METFTFYRRLIILFVLLTFPAGKLLAQRIFATSQQSGNSGLLCVNCVVNNPQNAADGNLQTRSVINVAVGVASSTYQELIFPATGKVAANTPVTIKIGTADNLLDLTVLGRITIRPYNGSTPVGGAIAANTLLTAVSNNDQAELTITPSGTYDRVRVTLNGGLLGALSSIYLYDAFYYGPDPLACNLPFDELHGISAGLLNLGVDVGGVANPQNAIDGDFTTASTLNASIAAVGAYAQQTIIFRSLSTVGDSVRLTLSIPQALIDAGVLANISLSTYNGNTSNDDSQSFNGALLRLRLLDLVNNRRRVTVTYAPTKIFDRVQLRLGGGIASILSSINLFEAERLIPKPIVRVNNVATTSTSICAGGTATFTIADAPGTTYKWYTASTGGTPVFTGANFTTPALTATTIYYVSAQKAGCTDESERAAIAVNVNQIPAAPVITSNNVTVCPGSTASFTAQAVTGVTINWYAAATGGTPLFTGNTFTTPAINQTTNYYAEAVAGSTCISATRTQVTATLGAVPAVPALTATNANICAGDVAVLSIASPIAGTIYNWYTTATGGTPVFTGVNFTTPALTANVTYYAEAVNATGCISTTRVQGTVTVQPKPANPTLAANNTTIAAGQTATINVTNPQTGVTYNWYTSLAAATPVFTGNSFTTPTLVTNTTYYVEAVNGAGCASANRTSITINVNINNNSPCTFANQQTPNVNGVCVGCFITNNALAVDADTTTASTITVVAGLLGGYAEQEMRYQQPGFTGDSVKVVLQTPVALTDVNLLGRISIALYNGTTLVGRYPLDNALLKVRLLGGGNRYAVLVPATGNYDRVVVRLNSGAASLLTSLNVFYAVQQFPAPVFNNANPEICKGSPATLSVTGTANGTFAWYTAPTGGTPVFTGSTYTTPALTANTTYYVEYTRTGGCVASTRYPIQVLVNDPPAKPVVVPSTANIFAGQTTSFTAQVANNVTVRWYTTPTGGTPVFTGTTFTTPALTANTTYYAESAIGDCVSPDRTPATVTVTPIVIPNVTVTPATQAVNPGASATLTASSTTPGAVFNWYSTATGGTSIFTGPVFTTPSVFTNITYYAEASIPATGAVSATRAPGAITVNSSPVNPVPCGGAIAQTNTTSGLLCLLCGINNATGAIDNDRNTFSQLATPVGLVGGYSQQTLRFANIGRIGDSIIVELGTPANLVSASVLSQISLATYNGATYNNDRFNLDGAAITISLLNGTSRFRVAFRATADFDRVEIRLNSGAAGVLTALNIYDATQSVAAPVISPATVVACAGTQATLTATVPAHVTVKWYTSATGGTPVFTGASFNTPVLTANTTYYAEASRTADGCAQGVRTPVTVNVTPVPQPPVVTTPTTIVCAGQPAVFTAQAVNGISFNWYATPTGGTPLFTGATFTTPALTANTSYYVEATGAGACGSSTRTQVTANVTTAPLVPTVSPNPAQTCAGSVAVLTASSTQSGVTFNWYTAATGGTPIFTGAQFTTPNLTSNTTYYVEAANGTCTSATRASVPVTVNPAPAAPVVTTVPSGGTISSGQTATLTATSTTSGVTFNWYTSAQGGTPIFTGSSFTTPALTSSRTYFVESVLTASGCTSPTRTSVTVTVVPIFSTDCDFASTQTNAANGLCVGCTITNATNAIDADTTTASQINVPVSVLGANATQTLIFSDGGLAGDTVKIKIGIPTGLLSAGVLDQLQIASYNGATYNGDRVNLSNSLIRVQFLAGGTAIIKFAPGANFDRVELRVNSIAASLLTTVNVYFASKQVDAPTLAANTINICAGGTATFAVRNPKAGVTYRWYTSATGGAPVFTGATFTSSALLTTTTYYVESVRTGNNCANPNRVAATANVTPSPVNPTLNQTTAQICAGEAVTFTVTNANGATVRWYNAATNGTLLFTGASFTVTPTSNATYFAEITNGTCSSPARTQATVTVNPRPAQPTVVLANVQVCANSPAVVQVQNPEAGVTYRWYTAATGGTAVFTGANFTTPAITANTNYYVEASGASGCTNNGGRTVVSVTVNSSINAPTLSATNTQVCAGGTATINVANPVAGVTYNWYTAATGGTSVFTGSTYTITNLSANVSYYVEASSNGCVSATRTRTDITVQPVPAPPQIDVAIGGSLSVCAGDQATITIANPDANLVYRWYDAPVNGNLLFVGAEFTTSEMISTTTYYVEASAAGNCNSSARTSIQVTVNQPPADPVLANANVSVCNGSPATLSINAPVAGVTYRWYNSPAMTTLLFTGTTYVTGPVTSTTNYYVAAFNSSGCSSNNTAMAQVTVRPAPAPPAVVNGNSTVSCVGSQANLVIEAPQTGFTYRWYTVATGGTPTFTGTTFTTPVLNATTTYYVEALNEDGCPSASRTAVTVTVGAPPTAPVIAATGLSICPASSTTINATAVGGNVVIRWYSNATGGTPLFTGSSFTTPVLNVTTTYYAEAFNTVTGCTSATRTAATVTILGPLPAPIVSVGNTSINSVSFTWTAVTGATGYEVSFDNGVSFAAPSAGANALTTLVAGLQPNQSVTIVVRAIGNLPCQLGANSLAVTGTATNPFGNGIYVPNAFTPNGDGNNDLFQIYGNAIQSATFTVYDQWGQLQFRANNKSAGWDGTFKGTPQPTGVYVYYLEAVLNDGTTFKKKGTVTLLR
ncbi:gliding motility-associated C-terminal domain-containing protein [Mucilaginibacter pallidiroseus]|uniref:Gliding motility-associated C-terminal domain-containing protein n=1 Tax=Mucilaginibacter pallidiroseus TaxID=2599295 RepID=A0A563U0Z8_9SPHI|nr:gliding motility-associated C-terminal domain-containing protein [Mucilaginibacter pallidiroseus]TWR25233.1 gliding motility-associated C-terminal domain-containing protein [Mucilaginibacter pallidiroseus]